MRKELFSHYRKCELCPRRCGVDRTRGEVGLCGETATLRIAAIEAHLGEEPPISGRNGSGTVFFSGCSLKCSYCQNFQISHEGLGEARTVKEAVESLAAIHRERGIHNVNFVTPDHFFPHTPALAEGMRMKGIPIPVVYNLSGYQAIQSLRLIEPHADIYLPDFKYSNRSLAARLSKCPDYPALALDAIAEMVRQKGFLDPIDASGNGDFSPAKEGVLVRHLILPGQVDNSLDVLTMLFLEFGGKLPLSLMSQYVPVRQFPEDSALNRPITNQEFETVLEHAQSLGFRYLFIQPLEETSQSPHPFLPDFTKAHPFEGNREEY